MSIVRAHMGTIGCTRLRMQFIRLQRSTRPPRVCHVIQCAANYIWCMAVRSGIDLIIKVLLSIKINGNCCHIQ